MKFKNTQRVYKTGSLSGLASSNDNIKIQVFYYVKKEQNGKYSYLYFSNGNYEFTSLSNATPLSKNEAIQYVNYFRKQNIKTTIFSSSKNSF